MRPITRIARRGVLGLVLAAGLAWAGGARASDSVSMHGYVVAKNAAQGTVQVGDRVYHLEPQTQLVGLAGQHIELAELPTVNAEDTGQEIPGAVFIEAHEVGGQWRLTSVHVVESVPR